MKTKLLLIASLMIMIVLMTAGLMIKQKQNQSYAAQIEYKTTGVSIDAFIGEYYFTLFGYASPNALVTLDGMGIFDQTYADTTGYFEFKNRFSPLAPREACLTAQDQFGRTTTPNCIPPFPTKYNVSIGPIIMPPTVSLDAANYYQGDDIKLSGQTIPNSNLTFSTFVDEKKSLMNYLSRKFDFPKPVEAFTFPQLSAQSDEKGNFSLSLPSSQPNFLRLFAQTSFDNSPSPQSINLNIKIMPVWMIIIQILLLLWSIIKAHLLEIVILGELIAISIFLLRRYLHPHVVARNRALALRKLLALSKVEEYPLVKEDTSITMYETHPLAIEELALMRRDD